MKRQLRRLQRTPKSGQSFKVVACDKKGQAMSEKNRKSFTSQHKAKVALDAIRGAKTLNGIAQEYTVRPTQGTSQRQMKSLIMYLQSLATIGKK